MARLGYAVEEERTVLMVGDGETLAEGLAAAMERHDLSVERCAIVGCAQAAIAVAPDLVLLVGDAAEEGGTDALGRLSESPLAAVVPVVLLADDERLHDRLAAFRFGATAVVPRSASVDAIATRVSELALEIPERADKATGELGEATLEEFAGMLTRELRNGILSVKGRERDETQVRIVLGEGRTVAEVVEGFVEKVRPLVRSAEVVRYEFQEQPGGTLQLLGADATDEAETPGSVADMRVLLADDDVTRADAVAQELRARGANVVMTDLAGSRLERARALDPEVLVIDAKAVEGDGYELVRRMREDVRLRWAFLLVVSWDEVWSEQARGPVVTRLLSRIARLGEPERSIRDRARAGIPFDTRLEATGPARLLRALAETQQTLRITVQGRRAEVRVDTTEGLVAGAACDLRASRETLEGPAALAALLGVARARVHIEPVLSPAHANVMATIDFALNSASGESSPIRPSEPVSKTYAMPDGERVKTVGSTRLSGKGSPVEGVIMAPRPDPSRALPPRTDNTQQGIAVPPKRPGERGLDEVGVPARPPTAKLSAMTPAPKVSLRGLGKRPSQPPPPPGAKAPPKSTLVGMPNPLDDLRAGRDPDRSVEPPTTELRAPEAPEDARTREMALPETEKRDSTAPLDDEPTLAAAAAPLDDEPTQAAIAAPPDELPPLDDEPTQAAASTPLADEPTQATAAPDAANVPFDDEDLGEDVEPRALTPLEAAPTLAAAPAPPELRDGPGPSPTPLPPPVFPAAPPAGGPSVQVASELTHAPAETDRVDLSAFDAPRKPSADATYKMPAVRDRKAIWALVGGFVLVVAVGVVLGLWMFGGDDDVVATELGHDPETAESTETGPEEPAGNGAEASEEEPGEAAIAEEAEAAEPSEEVEEAAEVAEETEPTVDGPPLPEVSVEAELPEVPRRIARMSARQKRGPARRFRARGKRAFRRRNYRQSLSLFRQSLQYEPESAAGAEGMGLALFKLGRTEESMAWLRRALEIEPEDPDLWVLVGDALGAQRDIRGARAAWEHALSLDRRHRAASRRLERLNRRAGR